MKLFKRIINYIKRDKIYLDLETVDINNNRFISIYSSKNKKTKVIKI